MFEYIMQIGTTDRQCGRILSGWPKDKGGFAPSIECITHDDNRTIMNNFVNVLFGSHADHLDFPVMHTLLASFWCHARQLASEYGKDCFLLKTVLNIALQFGMTAAEFWRSSDMIRQDWRQRNVSGMSIQQLCDMNEQSVLVDPRDFMNVMQEMLVMMRAQNQKLGNIERALPGQEQKRRPTLFTPPRFHPVGRHVSSSQASVSSVQISAVVSAPVVNSTRSVQGSQNVAAAILDSAPVHIPVPVSSSSSLVSVSSSSSPAPVSSSNDPARSVANSITDSIAEELSGLRKSSVASAVEFFILHQLEIRQLSTLVKNRQCRSDLKLIIETAWKTIGSEEVRRLLTSKPPLDDAKFSTWNAEMKATATRAAATMLQEAFEHKKSSTQISWAKEDAKSSAEAKGMGKTFKKKKRRDIKKPVDSVQTIAKFLASKNKAAAGKEQESQVKKRKAAQQGFFASKRPNNTQ